MAVQFNLLPDVKLEFAKQQSVKRMIFTIAALASAAALAIFIVAFLFVNVAQKKLLDDAGKDVTTYTAKVNSVPDLAKVLNVQNQLNSLPGLHSQKHYLSRLFTYIPEITPTSVSVGNINMDMGASTFEIAGTTDTIKTVNVYVDTFKFTNYIIGDAKDQSTCSGEQGNWNSDKKICTKPAFSNIVLTSVGRDDKGASYTIDGSFDPALFTGSVAPALDVPAEITTRSVLNAPDPNNPVFNGKTDTGSNQGSSNGGN